MESLSAFEKELRKVLASVRDIQTLDKHPWQKSLFVRSAVGKNQALGKASAGYQILYAISEVYLSSMPTTPPAEGKRLDPRWGQFGILGAIYFAPFWFKEPYPRSMREAWGKIDESIWKFVGEVMPEADSESYRFLAGEAEVPSSTLSDWKKAGLAKLAEAIYVQEQHLANETGQASVILSAGTAAKAKKERMRKRRRRWGIAYVLMAVVTIAALWLGWRGWRVSSIVQGIKANVSEIRQEMDGNLDEVDLERIDELAEESHDLAWQLEGELRPWIKMCGWFEWLPGIGYDLSHCDTLAEIYIAGVEGAFAFYQGGYELLEAVSDESDLPMSEEWGNAFHDLKNHFENVHDEVEEISALRGTIDAALLSGFGQRWIERGDAYLTLIYILDEGLYLAENAVEISEPVVAEIDNLEGLIRSPERLGEIAGTAAASLAEAQTHLDALETLRAGLDIEALHPEVRAMVTGYYDPYFPLARMGVDIAEFGALVGEPMLPALTYRDDLMALGQVDAELLSTLFGEIEITADRLAHVDALMVSSMENRQAVNLEKIDPEIASLVVENVDPHWPLLEMGRNLLWMAFELDASLTPFVEALSQEETDSGALLSVLEGSEARLNQAKSYMAEAVAARQCLDTNEVHPLVRRVLQGVGDSSMLYVWRDLVLLEALPRMVGLGDNGAQTYLILVQNEDEIRATGGFITAVGTVVIDDGQVVSMRIENSYDVDDPEGLYPYVPWQMSEYMGLGLWFLRDANWSPDFLDVADYAEELYAYYSGASVDGVVALNQEAIRLLLTELGPLELENDVVTADNVLEYMRMSRTGGEAELNWEEWAAERKLFIEEMADAMLDRMLNGTDNDWLSLLRVGLDAVYRRHILFALDDAVVGEVLYDLGWDGHMERTGGDYLMVVDSNLGYNKANAAVLSSFGYQIDLSNMAAPEARLSLAYLNFAYGDSMCVPGIDDEQYNYESLINRCYWNYLRVFPVSGARLLSSEGQDIPAEWMLNGVSLDGQVDILTQLDGGEGFGTMIVVPPRESVVVEFEYTVPMGVVSWVGGNEYLYQLHIQKQSGADHIEGHVLVTLPVGVRIEATSPDAVLDDGVLRWSFATHYDRELWVRFSLP